MSGYINYVLSVDVNDRVDDRHCPREKGIAYDILRIAIYGPAGSEHRDHLHSLYKMPLNRQWERRTHMTRPFKKNN